MEDELVATRAPDRRTLLFLGVSLALGTAAFVALVVVRGSGPAGASPYAASVESARWEREPPRTFTIVFRLTRLDREPIAASGELGIEMVSLGDGTPLLLDDATAAPVAGAGGLQDEPLRFQGQVAQAPPGPVGVQLQLIRRRPVPWWQPLVPPRWRGGSDASPPIPLPGGFIVLPAPP